eukprot:TRINITY_DN537_c0_g1_i1.p1 TRINITY_DN537_c0_g1~~TRINITY_DN537_c0_g1_i1.p1  ORF type:complete len:815 (-),score=238.85 TRINITY_DN537_c0_g1_i1:111-2297(-)
MEKFETLEEQTGDALSNLEQNYLSAADAFDHATDKLRKVEKPVTIPALALKQTSDKVCDKIFGKDCSETKCGMTAPLPAELNLQPLDTAAPVSWPLSRLREALKTEPVLMTFVKDQGHFAVSEAEVQKNCKDQLGVDGSENLQSNCKAFCQALAETLKEHESVSLASVLEQEIDVRRVEMQRRQEAQRKCENFKDTVLKTLHDAVGESEIEWKDMTKEQADFKDTMKTTKLSLKDIMRKLRKQNAEADKAKTAFDEADKKHAGLKNQFDTATDTFNDFKNKLKTAVAHLGTVSNTLNVAEDANTAAQLIKMKLVQEIHSFVQATDEAVLHPVTTLLKTLRGYELPVVPEVASKLGLEATGREIVQKCLAGKEMLNATEELADYNMGVQTSSKALCPFHGDKQQMEKAVEEVVTSTGKLQLGTYYEQSRGLTVAAHPDVVTPKGLQIVLQWLLRDEEEKAKKWLGSGISKGGMTETVGFEHEEACQDLDMDWQDADGKTCEDIKESAMTELGEDGSVQRRTGDRCLDGKPVPGYKGLSMAEDDPRTAVDVCCACGGGHKLSAGGELGLLQKLKQKFDNTPAYKEYFQFWAANGNSKSYFTLMLHQLGVALEALESAKLKLEKEEKGLKTSLEAADKEVKRLLKETEKALADKDGKDDVLKAARDEAKRLKDLLAQLKKDVEKLRKQLKKVNEQLEDIATTFKEKYASRSGAVSLLEFHAEQYALKVADA